VVAQCSASLPAAPTATDDCDGTISGIADMSGPFGQGDHMITWTYTDSHGNGSTQRQAVRVHDTIAPVADAESLPDVVAQCSANLPAAPTATDACDGAITGQPDKTGPFVEGDTLVTWTFKDSHNNMSIQTQWVKVHDTLPAVITAWAPDQSAVADGSLQGTVPDFTTDETASDNCTADQDLRISQDPPAGTKVGLGKHRVAVAVLDSVGNDNTRFPVFAVEYQGAGVACNGNPGHVILPPISADGRSVFKQGSTVPAKFRVFDANCHSVGTPGVVTSFEVIRVIPGTTSEVGEAVASTTPDTAFRWSHGSTASDGQWIFNISTKTLLANNTYVFVITLNDGSAIQFRFGLR